MRLSCCLAMVLTLAAMLPRPTFAEANPKYESKLIIGGKTPGNSVAVNVDIEGAKQLFLVVQDGGDGMECDWADWVEPRLTGPAGTKKLTDLGWAKAEAGWGQVQKNHSVNGGPLELAGKTFEYGIGTHANSVIEFALPPGYTRFHAHAGIDDGAVRQQPHHAIRFLVYTEPPPAEILASPQIKASPFSSVVRWHFADWDHDHDGTLTPEETDDVFKRAQLKGLAAAAAAVLKFYSRDHIGRQLWRQGPQTDNMLPLTLARLQTYEEAWINRTDRPPCDEWFGDFRARVEQTPRELFPEKLPKLTVIAQGHLGDCYLMSMVGALVHRSPQHVCQMIEQVDDKKYAVHFAGAKQPVQILAPSDAEIALNSSARQNGLWLTVLEKAYAAHVNRQQPKGKRDKVVSDKIAFAGFERNAVALLTGHDTASVQWNDPKLQTELRKAAAAKCLIFTGVRGEVKAPAPLHPGHSYAVLDYDSKTHQMTIFDPGGEDFSIQGPPGLQHGYEIKSGVLSMPYQDFVQVFWGIGHELKGVPAPHLAASDDGDSRRGTAFEVNPGQPAPSTKPPAKKKKGP